MILVVVQVETSAEVPAVILEEAVEEISAEVEEETLVAVEVVISAVEAAETSSIEEYKKAERTHRATAMVAL